MRNEETAGQRPSVAVAGAGVDHVRLLYHYIDLGDLDGCASLLDEDVRLEWPQVSVGRGRAQVLGLHERLAGPPARHQTDRVIACGEQVAVTGRFFPAGADQSDPAAPLGFADFFTLTADGLLQSHRRYYFVPPG